MRAVTVDGQLGYFFPLADCMTFCDHWSAIERFLISRGSQELSSAGVDLVHADSFMCMLRHYIIEELYAKKIIQEEQQMQESVGLVTDEMVLFWNGPFSQWHPSNFTVNGVEYNCAEQFMMAEKARLFGDAATLEAIMDTDSPKEQKKLGRQVDNFEEDKWNEVAQEVVYKGNLAKFKQNVEFKSALLGTGNRILVEASPYDRIWGIGLPANDPRAQDRTQWLGTNWLGEALARVRDTILSEGL